MSCEINQCCAVVQNNKRCSNLSINPHMNHCSIHHDNAVKLYTQYKQICEVAYNLDINKSINNMNDQIKHLMNCYVWLNKAFYARLKHRKYAFVPECYDKGHNIQFEMINEKLDVCEKK